MYIYIYIYTACSIIYIPYIHDITHPPNITPLLYWKSL